MNAEDPGIRPLSRGPEFTLANKIGRVVWQAAWFALARWTPPQLHGWRRLILRMFGARVGAQARIYASVRIWSPRNLEIGTGALVGPRVWLYNQGRIEIGAHAVISQDASICASTHDVDSPDFALQKRPVSIGNGCWVGAEAFVGPGVTMATASVLGARAALFEDAAARTIYRGNPASALRSRRVD